MYLKLVPPVFLGLLVTSCVFAPGYYKSIIRTKQGALDGQILVDVVMAAVAAVIGLVAQTLLFVQALTISTKEDENFSHSSETEKLVVPDEVEHSSTLPRRGDDDSQAPQSTPSASRSRV
jgi:uncharacterized membrane protein YqhA